MYYIVGIGSYTKTVQLKEIVDNFLHSIWNTCPYPREFKTMNPNISDVDKLHSFHPTTDVVKGTRRNVSHHSSYMLLNLKNSDEYFEGVKFPRVL